MKNLAWCRREYFRDYGGGIQSKHFDMPEVFRSLRQLSFCSVERYVVPVYYGFSRQTEEDYEQKQSPLLPDGIF